ncbi:hypothetical protein TH25_04720 [Thalassospira profundimaris]|uniref:Guanylate cyclase n=1 Tax=Thalassospira profundimaris TaxID=502049 RepID=A0A367XKY0_9PROT|nr:adenylate/guanylate cyclase domain-containing protein [Thalassospira profundimaris]RCK53800.1 hypothetical protein TH25_04720 [Thalassospira profundimaris]
MQAKHEHPSKLRRYVIAMAGMATIDFCFTGAYVLISGHSSVLARALMLNIVVLIGVNAVGAALLFRPINRAIKSLQSGDRTQLAHAKRRLNSLHIHSTLWAFCVGLIYCTAAFGSGVFLVHDPALASTVPLATRITAGLWFSFAYAAHFAIYAYFAALDRAETVRRNMFENWQVAFAPGQARIGPRLAIVFLLLTLISSLAILLDLTLFPEIRALQGLSTQQAVILDVIATETAAILCLFFINRTLTRPIRYLRDVMQKIARADFTARSPIASDDEIGQLAADFNHMAAGLAERENMRRAFERYVSRDVVELALQREQSGDPRAAGELRFATVMFCDISDFTAMSENLAPQQVISLLNDYFDQVNAPIRHHGGVVMNYVGDALHAAFNVLHDDPYHAIHALDAALGIRNITRNSRFGDDNLMMKTRIGIHSGPVVAGPVGSSDRIDFTIQGDTANLASRLENYNKETGTEILISKTTRDLIMAHRDLQRDVSFIDLGEHAIRGRQSPVGLFTVADTHTSPNPPETNDR